MTRSTSIVIFGASGDLTNRKLIPALLNLYCKGRLPESTRIIGTARRPYSHEEFRDVLEESARRFMGDAFEPERWGVFREKIWYSAGSLKELDDFKKLDRLLVKLEGGPADRLYYLSVSPDLYVDSIQNLAQAGMNHSAGGWRRIVIEKPFGHDLESARGLNEAVHAVFDEDQVYRIDHYLGKETAKTSCSSASPTRSSSRSGTAAMSTTCRSPSRNRAASVHAGASTRRPAPRATSSRTTRSSCSD